MKELEKEFSDLQLELKELEREVKFHQEQGSSADPEDLFLPTTEGFVSNTKEEFHRFEVLFKDMKKKFNKALIYFGEDPRDSGVPSVEEMFGTFAVFLQHFSVSQICLMPKLHNSSAIIIKTKINNYTTIHSITIVN